MNLNIKIAISILKDSIISDTKKKNQGLLAQTPDPIIQAGLHPTFDQLGNYFTIINSSAVEKFQIFVH